jgi:hypothetical protein
VNALTDWQPTPAERLLVASAALEWARGLLRRSRDHLERSESERARPIAEELTDVHERLSGLERLLQVIHTEERNQSRASHRRPSGADLP